jgi:hypothetical protein
MLEEKYIAFHGNTKRFFIFVLFCFALTSWYKENIKYFLI